jgi:hypothetical protein
MSQGATVVLETNALTERAHMQDVINRLYEHFIVNKAQPGYDAGDGANREGNGCLYRTGEGHCCAVGLFIPYDLFVKYGADDINVMGGVKSLPQDIREALPVATNLDFWEDLQTSHDNAAEVNTEDFHDLFGRYLHTVCSRYNLKWPADAIDEARAIDAMIAEGGRH